MLFLFGRYLRDRQLPPTTDRCPRCGYTVPIHWRHQYKTGHFFFFPLFSFGQRMTATCSHCRHEAVAMYPGGKPPMPLLDRLGWAFPFGVAGLCVVGFVALVGFAVATAKPLPPDSAEYKAYSGLEYSLTLGKTTGDGPGAKELADAIFKSLVDDSYAKTDIAVGARVSDRPSGEPKGHVVLVLLQYSQLSQLSPTPRTMLAKQLHDLIAPKLADADRVVVIVKGSILEGILMSGEANDDWPIETDSVIPKDHIEKALGPHPAADAGAPAPSASASAAPADSAPPATSASASPPKKKKKKKPASATE